MMHIHSLVFGAGLFALRVGRFFFGAGLSVFGAGLFALASCLFALASCLPLAGAAQTAPPPAPRVFAPHDMGRWGIPAGNYSGIAPLGGDRYALVSDKQEADGWIEVSITFGPDGDISSMKFEGAHLASAVRDSAGAALASASAAHASASAAHASVRDAEDIVATEDGTVFVCAENDQRIIELDAEGRATGRELDVPEWCGVAHIFNNYGFEALARNAADGSFWTTTEHSLRADASSGSDAAPRPSGYGNPVSTVHRLLHFDKDLQYVGACTYRSEAPRADKPLRAYAFGVPAMTAAPDGSLYVMEREMAVTPRFVGSWCRVAIFRVNPTLAKDSAVFAKDNDALAKDNDALAKEPIVEFSTRLRLVGRKTLANYEGMCFGPERPDGRRSLLLVADSQNRAGNTLYRLKDYIRVVVL